MDPHIYDVGRKLLTGLGPATPMVRICAYGSPIRRDHDAGSDLDPLVALEHVTARAKPEIRNRALQLSLEGGYVISVAIVSRGAFENGPLSASEYARHVRREAI